MQQQAPKIKDIVNRCYGMSLMLNDAEKKFLLDIKNKRKLTVKQDAWLRKIANKCGVVINGEFAHRQSFDEKHAFVKNCEHPDLGSLGYTHGSVVTCPYCGQAARVW